ncbi:MAG TPA: HAMP domain-containing sensor histidine kinase [Methylomirabilota bacterium]|nr:HAMP domain-containing sensor histidine kinase [Methylomirabilota bacterium]
MTLTKRFLLPRSQNRDVARQEFILNVLLLGSMGLTIVAFLQLFFAFFFHSATPEATAPIIIFLFLLFLVFLFYLSRKGKIRLSAFSLIILLIISALYTSMKWGADVTQAWLMYALTIVMSGILIGTRFAIFITFFLVFALTSLGFLQLAGIDKISTSWRKETFTIGDTILLNITLIVIAIISWLSNREIEKALHRAWESEEELKKERDLLEIKVEERTQELKRAQAERLTQLYRFAEMGRLTAGFFHDLVTPLSLVSLNLHKLNDQSQKKEVANIRIALKRAMNGTTYLENFVIAVRKQLQQQDIQKTFSLNHEIKDVISILGHKANSLRVKIIFEAPQIVKAFGNPLKFNQIIMNLIVNAIDAYTDSKKPHKERIVHISIDTTERNIFLRVKDFGSGVKKDDLEKIFEPFFTTKPAERGIGLGLSITRDMIKQNFKGKLLAKSTKANGTVFTVTFPKRYPKIKQTK